MRDRRLWLVLALAWILRLINLGERSLWYDEAFAVLFSEKGLDAMLYGTLEPVAGGASDIHPLLYYSTLNVWMGIFGQAAFAVRLWSVLLGLLTVLGLYVVARELFDHKTGLAAALIVAIAPFHVQYSQEARMYALLGLLLLAVTWCFIKGWRDSEAGFGKAWRWWLVFGVLAGLAMYTQQLAAFYLVALGVIPVLTRRRNQLLGVMLGTAAAVVIYLPWLVNLPGQLAKVNSYYWLTPPNAARPLATMRSFLVVNLDLPAPASMIALLGAIFISLFMVVQVIIYLRRRAKPDQKALLFVLWLTVFPAALMWVVSQVQPVYLERSLLPSALMLYVALGWMFTRSGLPRPIAVLLGGIGLVLAGIGLYYQYTWATFPNSPFQRAVTHIEANWSAGDVVVHQNKLTALPMVYYGRDIDQRYLQDAPGSSEDTLALPTQQALGLLADACIQAARKDGERVWLVMFSFAEAQYAEANRPEIDEMMTWLDSHYSEISRETFNDLNVILYTNPRDVSDVCGEV